MAPDRFIIRRLAWLLLAVGLAASLAQVARRAAVEGASRSVELVVDYEQFAELARREGMAPVDLLLRLKEAGVTSVGVPELTLKELRLQGRAALLDWWQAVSLREVPADSRPRPGAVYVLLADADLAAWAESSLKARLGPGRVVRLSPRLLEVLAVEKDLSELGLGFRAEQLGPLSRAGLLLVPRVSNSPHLTEADLRAMFDTLEGQRVSTVLLAGKQALGFPDHAETTARELERRGMSLGVVETDIQLGNLSPSGMEDLQALAEGRMVRVFSVPEWLLTRRTPDEVVDAAMRAVEERNARLVYLRPMVKGIEPFMEAEQNAGHLESIAERLRGRGFTLGRARPFAPLTVPLWVEVAVGLGIIGAALLLLDVVARPGARLQGLFLALGLLAVPAGTAVAPSVFASLLALAAAIIFPVLGLALACERWRRPPAVGGVAAGVPAPVPAAREAVATLFVAGVTALTGGLFIGALLAERSYLLEWSFFRGVKLALALPPLLAGAVYLGVLGLSGRRPAGWRTLVAGVRDLAALAIRFKHVLALAAAAGLVALYLIRSGNASAGFIPRAELEFRTFLEQTLVARPRTKEFLFGHPALMLAVLFHRRGERLLALLLTVMGAVGLASLVNSFEHLRTPVVVALWRTFNGLWLGLLVGAAVLAAATVVIRAWERLGPRLAAADGDEGEDR